MVDDEVDSGDFEGAEFDEVSGAVAEVGELEVRVAGELESGGDEDGVDLDAGGSGEFEVECGGLVALGSAGEDPSAAGEEGSGEIADEALRFVGAQCGQLETPSVGGLALAAVLGADSMIVIVGHTELIGLKTSLV